MPYSEHDPEYCNATKTGNAYESLIGLWYLEGKIDSIRSFMLTIMAIDQPESKEWTPADRHKCVFPLRGSQAL
eukprot:14872938-Heterocapsa_arctica.AAC.1